MIFRTDGIKVHIESGTLRNMFRKIVYTLSLMKIAQLCLCKEQHQFQITCTFEYCMNSL